MASALLTDQVSKLNTAWGQDVDNAVYNYLTSVSGTNTITATGPAGLAAYAAGLKFRFIPAATNTGATTINITGTGALGARNIFSGGVALVGSELTVGIPAEITDDGTRFHLSGPAIGRTIAKRKTADESVTSSTSLQDDDHLVFSIAANEEWIGTIDYDFGAAVGTTGIRVGITFPAGSTLKYGSMGISDVAGQALYTYSVASNTVQEWSAATFTGGGNAGVRMSFWVLNGATPGSVTARFAQATSSVTAITAKKGSFMQATRVA